MRFICWKFVLFSFIYALSASLQLKAQEWYALPNTDSWRIYDVKSRGNLNVVLDAGDASLVAYGSELRLVYLDNNGSVVSSSSWTKGSGVDSVIGKKMCFLDTLTYVVYSSFSSGVESQRVIVQAGSAGWSQVNKVNQLMSLNSDIVAMESYNGKVFFGGKFPVLFQQGVLGYDPLMDSVNRRLYADGIITSLATYSNRLFIGGNFDTLDGDGIPNLAGYNDTFVFTISFPVGVRDVSFLKNVNNSLVYFENENQSRNLVSFSGSGFDTINSRLPDDFVLADVEFLNGSYYVISTTAGNDLLPPGVLAKSVTESWKFLRGALLDPSNSKLVTVNGRLILFEMGEANTNTKSYALSNAYVEGTVFVDLVNFCAYGPGDGFAAGVIVYDTTSKVFVKTNDTGYFYMSLTPGQHYLTFTRPDGKFDFSPCLSLDTFTFNIGPNSAENILVPMQLKDTVGFLDLNLMSSIGMRARQGFSEVYTLSVTNESSKPTSCKVTLVIPDEMQWIDAEEPLFDSTYHTYRWQLSMNPFSHKEFHFRTKVGITSPSDTIQMKVSSELLCMDSATADSLELVVVGAFDPNDKQCHPSGFIEPGTSFIKYHINFQNTGTDTAYRVTIIDTVDTRLTPTKVKVLGASHPKYSLKVINNTLHFTFDNILLPDSTRDLAGSQGYVQYRVNLDPNMKEGDSVLNTAYIYFDYQKHIKTNTVVSRLDKKNSVVQNPQDLDNILLYPNPSTGLFMLKNPFDRPFKIGVYDANGKFLKTIILSPLSTGTYDMLDFSQGIYFLRMIEENHSKVLVVVK